MPERRPLMDACRLRVQHDYDLSHLSEDDYGEANCMANKIFCMARIPQEKLCRLGHNQSVLMVISLA